MNRAPISVAALVFAGICSVLPAQALPLAPPVEPIAASQPALSMSVRYYRHHWHHRHYWHYRHYSFWHYRNRYSAAAAPERTDAGMVKPGRWEFITQLQTPAMQQAPSGTPVPQGAEAQSGGGVQTSYSACITPSRAVPAELGPQCKLDSTRRNGSALAWSMTCTNAQGAVRSEGVASYAGATMEGSMVNHVPGAGGKVLDMTQRITGRYLGPCIQAQR